MIDMFFMGINSSEFPKSVYKTDIAGKKLEKAGFKAESILSSIAIYEGCPDGGEEGAVVRFGRDLGDGFQDHFLAALSVKENLRHGAYTVLLDESSLPNRSFESYVYPRSKEEVARMWCEAAAEIAKETGVFVSGFVFQTWRGTFLIGNANPVMVGNVNVWMQAVEKLCVRVRASCPVFYETEAGNGANHCRRKRIGYLGDELAEVTESIH